MGTQNKKNNLYRIIILFSMLLFAACLTMNVFLCGNYHLYELSDKATVFETCASFSYHSFSFFLFGLMYILALMVSLSLGSSPIAQNEILKMLEALSGTTNVQVLELDEEENCLPEKEKDHSKIE